MDEPETVTRATDAYQTDSDAVKRFVTTYCVTGPHVHARSRDLFTAWTEWATADGAEKLSEKAFGAELDRLGYPARRTKAGMVRGGLALPAEDPETGGGEGW